MKIKAFITHKISENFTDCQDRFGINPNTKAIAVSDGVSATWQQKIWAQLLVDTFVSYHFWTPSKETIEPLCNEWRERVIESIQSLKDTNAPESIIYRNERNLIEGSSAGATFVGIRFNGKEWSGSVLGDSCLIEWNGHEAKFHTSQDGESFDNFPDYFDSNVLKEGRGTPKSIGGTLANGDCLLLVSDPLSDFLLGKYNQGYGWQYIAQLLGIPSHEEFEDLVEKWRKEGMHNDDTTLVVVDNDGLDDFTIVAADDINAFIGKEKEDEKKVQETIIEQSVDGEEQAERKYRGMVDSVPGSTPIDANSIIEEVLSILFKCTPMTPIKKRRIMWWDKVRLMKKSVVRKALEKVLKEYVIYKK